MASRDDSRSPALLIAVLVLGIALVAFLVLRRGNDKPTPAIASASAPRAVEERGEAPRRRPDAAERAESRRARDAMREKIIEALRKRSPSPPHAPPPAEAAPAKHGS